MTEANGKMFSPVQGKQIRYSGIQWLTTLSFKREGEIKILAEL